MKNDQRRFPLLALLFLFLVARILQLFAGRVLNLLIVTFHVIPPALFAVVHGARIYRSRGILIFAALCLGVGILFESVSLRTGFPFGYYRFTDLMGPKLFDLPILLALAYVGMGYLVVGSRYRNPGLPERTALGEKDRFGAAGGKLCHDGLGLFHGRGLGRHRSRGCGEMEARTMERRLATSLLVSHCLHLLSAIRVVSQKPSDHQRQVMRWLEERSFQPRPVHGKGARRQ